MSKVFNDVLDDESSIVVVEHLVEACCSTQAVQVDSFLVVEDNLAAELDILVVEDIQAEVGYILVVDLGQDNTLEVVAAIGLGNSDPAYVAVETDQLQADERQWFDE